MKKKHPEHVNLERWLVSYADFITLLFAFFVVMYAISQADMAKFKAVAGSMKAAFHSGTEGGAMPLNGAAGGDTVNQFDSPNPAGGGRIQDMPAGKTNTAADPDPSLQEVRELLEESISLEVGAVNSSDALQMAYDSRGLVLRLAVNDFFDPGEIEPRQDLRPLLDRIGRVLATTKRLIRVEGHTDQSEDNMKGTVGSWELSAARAAWVVRYWLKRFDVDPRRIGIAGYAHFRPIGDSRTEMGRGRNRRIEVIVLNNKYETN